MEIKKFTVSKQFKKEILKTASKGGERIGDDLFDNFEISFNGSLKKELLFEIPPEETGKDINKTIYVYIA